MALSLPSQKHDVEISIVNQNKNASVVDELFHDTLSKGFDELLDGIVKALHWDEIVANSTDTLEEDENSNNNTTFLDDIEDTDNENTMTFDIEILPVRRTTRMIDYSLLGISLEFT